MAPAWMLLGEVASHAQSLAVVRRRGPASAVWLDVVEVPRGGVAPRGAAGSGVAGQDVSTQPTVKDAATRVHPHQLSVRSPEEQTAHPLEGQRRGASRAQVDRCAACRDR